MSKTKRPVPSHLIPWKKGQSGNPGGRPKGAKGLAKYLRSKLGDDLHVVGDVMIEILLGKSKFATTESNRVAAAHWLADRAVGKAEDRVIINSNADVSQQDGVAISRLSDSDLEALDAIVGKMRENQTDPNAPAFDPEELH